MGCYPAFLGYFCLRLPPSQHLEKLTDFRLFIFAVHLYIAPTVGKECIYFQSCRELSYSERSSDLAPKTAVPVQAPLWSNVGALQCIKGSYPAAGLTNVVRSTQGIQREQNICPGGNMVPAGQSPISAAALILSTFQCSLQRRKILLSSLYSWKTKHEERKDLPTITEQKPTPWHGCCRVPQAQQTYQGSVQ